MEQIRAPQAAPEWPSAELGIDEKRSLRKGVKSAFNRDSTEFTMLFTCHLLAINTDTRALTRDLPALYPQFTRTLPAVHPHFTRDSPALSRNSPAVYRSLPTSLTHFTRI